MHSKLAAHNVVDMWVVGKYKHSWPPGQQAESDGRTVILYDGKLNYTSYYGLPFCHHETCTCLSEYKYYLLWRYLSEVFAELTVLIVVNPLRWKGK